MTTAVPKKRGRPKGAFDLKKEACFKLIADAPDGFVLRDKTLANTLGVGRTQLFKYLKALEAENRITITTTHTNGASGWWSTRKIRVVDPMATKSAIKKSVSEETEDDFDWSMIIGPVKKKEEPKENQELRAQQSLAELKALHDQIVAPQLEHERRLQEDPEYKANFQVQTYEAYLKQKRRSGIKNGQ